MFVLSFLPSTDRCLFLILSAVSWKEACLIMTTLRTYPSIAKRTCTVFLNKVRRTRLCLETILTYGGLITNVWGILKKVIRQSETAISLFLIIRLNWKLYINIQFLIKKSGMSIFWKILKSNDEEKVHQVSWNETFAMRLLAVFQFAYTLISNQIRTVLISCPNLVVREPIVLTKIIIS